MMTKFVFEGFTNLQFVKALVYNLTISVLDYVCLSTNV